MDIHTFTSQVSIISYKRFQQILTEEAQQGRVREMNLMARMFYRARSREYPIDLKMILEEQFPEILLQNHPILKKLNRNQSFNKQYRTTFKNAIKMALFSDRFPAAFEKLLKEIERQL